MLTVKLQTFILLFLLLLSNTICGQLIQTGEPYETTEPSFKAYMPRKSDVLVLKTEEDKTTFYKIDTDKLAYSYLKTVKLPDDATALEKVVQMGNKHYAIYYSSEKGIYIGEFDLANAEFTGELKKFNLVSDHHPLERGMRNPYYRSKKWGRTTDWDIRVSPDQKHLLFTGFTAESDKKYFHFTLINQDLEIVWSKKVNELPSALDKKYVSILVEDFSVDTKDNIYISTLATASTSYKYKHELCKITPEGKVSLIDLTDVGYPVLRAWVTQNNNGEINCMVGFCKNAKKNVYDGLAFGTIKNDQFVKKSSKDIFPSFNKKVNFFRGMSVLLASEYRCILKEVSYGEDNSIIFFYQFEYMAWPNLAEKDNVIIKVNSKGEIDWVHNIPHNQQAFLGLLGMGSKYIRTEYDHYIFFAERRNSPDKYSSKPAKKFTEKHRSFLSCYRISDGSGKMTKYKVLDTRRLKAHNVHFNDIIYIGNNEFVIEVFGRRKKNTLLKVKLE